MVKETNRASGRIMAALLAVVLCIGAFSTAALAKPGTSSPVAYDPSGYDMEWANPTTSAYSGSFYKQLSAVEKIIYELIVEAAQNTNAADYTTTPIIFKSTVAYDTTKLRQSFYRATEAFLLDCPELTYKLVPR